MNSALFLQRDECPFGEDEWYRLDCVTSEAALNFEKIEMGDTDESHLLYKAALISDKGRPKFEQAEVAKQVLAFLDANIMHFCSERLQILEPFIFRAQVHLLNEGCFIGHHVDNAYKKDYLYSMTFHFRRDYDGGCFVTDAGQAFSSRENGLIVCPGPLGHKVEKVMRGQRKTLTIFIGEREGNCYS